MQVCQVIQLVLVTGSSSLLCSGCVASPAAPVCWNHHDWPGSVVFCAITCCRPHGLLLFAPQAQCTNHMHLPTALELMSEMRQRNVQPNTHTYSSMLNVCIKAGELDLALDVFEQVGGLQPGVAHATASVGRVGT